MSELPQGLKPRTVLKKVGEASSFILSKGGPILPNGKFVLTYDFKEGTAGQLSLSLTIDLEQVSTNSATYQELAKVTITGVQAYLDEISMYSDTPDTAQFRLTIRRNQKFADKKIQTILVIDGKGTDLKKGDIVLLEVKSDGATTIVADGFIQVREVS
jgi:hypothetical protein